MTTLDPVSTRGGVGYDDADLQQKAKDHLWMHFARQSTMETSGVPIITRGEGHHIYDIKGREYFDGLSGLFVVNAGHGRRRLAEVAAKQAEQLAFFPICLNAFPAPSTKVASEIGIATRTTIRITSPVLRLSATGSTRLG